MARVNIYLPDEMAAQARAAGLNVSKTAQAAIHRELAGGRTASWLEQVRQLPPSGVSHEQALDALDGARDEVGDRFA